MNAPTCALCQGRAEVSAILGLEHVVLEAPLCEACLDAPDPHALSKLSAELDRTVVAARSGGVS